MMYVMWLIVCEKCAHEGDMDVPQVTTAWNGTFPDKPKLAKITPSVQSGAIMLMIRYVQVSILPLFSEVL